MEHRRKFPTERRFRRFWRNRNLKPAEVVAEVNDEILGPDDLGRLLRPQDRLNAFRIVAGG